MRLAILLLLTTACTRPVATAEPIGAVVAPWCVAVSAAVADRAESGLICAESAATCGKVRAAAIRYGALGRVQSVGECNRNGGEQ